MAAGIVEKLYHTVIEDVINNVRESFLDEGIDEQVLLELKQIWEKKLTESKVIEQREPEVMSRVVIQTSTGNHITHSMAPINAPPPAPPPLTSAIAHQLTFPSSNVMQQALLQYAATSAEGGNDGQKTVTLTMPQKLTITLPAHLAQSGLQTVMSAPAAAATLALPPEVTASLLQQAANTQNAIFTQAHTLQGDGLHYQQLAMGHQTTPRQQPGNVIQLDGAHDSSDDDDEEEDLLDNDDDRDDDDDQKDDDQEESGEDDEPLNSEDDVSDNDPTELFDTDNVVVCQYDKITRSRNRWKLHLKDGIMNLQGKDFVFQKAVGDAEW